MGICLLIIRIGKIINSEWKIQKFRKNPDFYSGNILNFSGLIYDFRQLKRGKIYAIFERHKKNGII